MTLEERLNLVILRLTMLDYTWAARDADTSIRRWLYLGNNKDVLEWIQTAESLADDVAAQRSRERSG